MKNPRIVCFVALFLAFLQNVFGQGFINLDFEDSYIVGTTRANVPGWTAYDDAWEAVNYSGGTTLPYNNETLDAAAAILVGLSYPQPYARAPIDGFSVRLKGGNLTPYKNGASIGQTGRIPVTAKSITYFGTAYFQVSFQGHVLPLSVLDTYPEYYPGLALFAADISSYAGQTGELLFHSSWPSDGGVIDLIKFSTSQIPEPHCLTLFGIGAFCIGLRTRRRP